MRHAEVGNPIIIVQGGQYGSEAKGAITGYICQEEKVDIAVRTGAVNAGHTVIHKGQTIKMQQLPVGWVNPDTQLVIGAGALVHLEILASEVKLVSRLLGEDIRERLVIDFNAGVHTSEHTDRSTVSGRHHAIGATGKGSSEALIDKIRLRGKGYQTFGRYSNLTNDYNVGDTARYLNHSWDAGKKILLEGTQGTLLDLHTGPYPYTTHKSCLPAAWMAECGLSPGLPTDIVMVVRTYPIRVAGNSGFLPLEMSWPELAREVNEKRRAAGKVELVSETALREFENAITVEAAGFEIPDTSLGLDQHKWEDRFKYQIALSELNAAALQALRASTYAELCRFFELTTVTRKLRRVAKLSLPDLHHAAQLVRPDRVALMFMNYEFPESWFTDDDFSLPAVLSADEQRYTHTVEHVTDAPVSHISYGPGPEHVLRRL